MLRITIPPIELFDDANKIFINTKECHLQLEHSLVSIAKWESKWQKPFLTTKNKTREETLDYIRCMTVNEQVCVVDYNLIPKDVMDRITDYIDAPMTATTFTQTDQKPTNKQVVTAEIIYYWMITFNVPFECQKWHLNRLLTLINVCSINSQPKKKMSRREAANKQKALNEARRAQYKTSG
jgi:hypothetical protein